MKQILHIFRKDTRHFWPEILASLLVTALCTLHIPMMWGNTRAASFLTLVATLRITVPLSWWLLIARATHDETLVGDEQFWITRPYEWKKLLAAKFLFIAAWIGVPYLITQSYLLAEAGFSPLPYVPGLLANLLVASALILPLFAVAAVTANFARMTLTLLGVLVTAIAVTFFYNNSHGYQTSNPYHNHFFFPLILGLCAIAITLQYATRRAWLSRTILLVLPVLVGISFLAYNSQSLVDRAYPQPSAASTPPMVASLDVDPHWPPAARSWQGDDFIDLGIQYSGIADGYVLDADNFKFSLTAADGDQWTSPWQAFRGTYLPGTHSAGLNLKLSQATYDRFKSAPVTMHITLALTRLQSDTVTQIPTPSHTTFIPGIGFCSPMYNRADPSELSTFACRSALRRPRRTYGTTLWSSAPCSSTPPPPEATVPGTMWIGTPDSGDLLSRIASAINPVPVTFFALRITTHVSDDSRWSLCPGIPITLTQYHIVDRTQSDITIPNFQLPANVTQTGY
jgi:hypothetical protein